MRPWCTVRLAQCLFYHITALAFWSRRSLLVGPVVHILVPMVPVSRTYPSIVVARLTVSGRSKREEWLTLSIHIVFGSCGVRVNNAALSASLLHHNFIICPIESSQLYVQNYVHQMAYLCAI